jgi:hypothetical protein
MSRDDLYKSLLKNKRCKCIIDDAAVVKENYINNDAFSDLTLFLKDNRFSDWCYFMRVTYSGGKLSIQCIDMPIVILD